LKTWGQREALHSPLTLRHNGGEHVTPANSYSLNQVSLR